MEERCLSDKNTYPDDEVLSRYLGKAKHAWDSFLDVLAHDYPLLSAEWRYYNDGKSWLCKVTKKAKTVCWIGIYPGYFKVTFYYGDAANDIIIQSPLEQKLKDEWMLREKIGKIRPITVCAKKKADMKTVKQLIEIKSMLKK